MSLKYQTKSLELQDQHNSNLLSPPSFPKTLKTVLSTSEKTFRDSRVSCNETYSELWNDVDMEWKRETSNQNKTKPSPVVSALPAPPPISSARGTTPLLQPPTKVTNTTAGNGTSSDGDMKTNQSAKSSCQKICMVRFTI